MKRNERAVDFVYREWGVYEAYKDANGSTPDMDFPIFKDVLEYVEGLELKGRKAGWQDSTERAVDLLCFPELSHVLNVRRPVPFEKLLQEQVILELDALTDPDKVFFTETMLLWIYHQALSRTVEREKFISAIFIEEAHHVLTKKKQEMSGEETIIDRMVRMFRELGVGFVIVDQSPSLISNTALANTYCTIAMNLKHEADINAAANTMLLSAEEKKFLGQLPVGLGVAKLQGRYPKPFLVKFPHSGIVKGSVSDQELTKLKRKLTLEVELSDRPGLFLTPDHGDKHFTGKKEEIQKVRKQKIARKLKVNMVRLLNDVVANAEATYLERMKRLTLSGYTADKVKNDLLFKGYMKEEDAVGPTGRPFKRFLVTDSGREFLVQNGSVLEDIEGTRRHGGMVHQEVLRRLAEQLNAEGWHAQIEFPVGQGRQIDMVAEKNGRRIAVELETGSAREGVVSNIKKCLDAGYEVYSVGLDQRVTEKIRADCRLANLDQDPRVRVAALSGLIVA